MRLTYLLFGLLLPVAALGQKPSPSVDLWDSKSALTFETNQGQTGADIRYLARTGAGIVMFTDTGITLPAAKAVTGFEFVNPAGGASWSPSDATGDTTTYLVGRDSAKWARDVA